MYCRKQKVINNTEAMNSNSISIIIPTLNEEGNVHELACRIHSALKKAGIVYEIIFIDDHSSDGTCEMIRQLSASYPIILYSKLGKRGKAHSLLEGFSYANFDLIAILDADLQYPPEALPDMVEKIRAGCDVVVVNRTMRSISPVRRIISGGFNLFFSKMLHGFDFDVQAGMKVFKKEVVKEIKIDPSPWTFDLEFLLKARFYGYMIGSVDIDFASRKQGKSKIEFQKAIYEIGSNAIKLKFKKIPQIAIFPKKGSAMMGAGVAFSKKRFITHTTLDQKYSAAITFVPWQRNVALLAIAVFLTGLYIDPIGILSVVVALLSAIYFLDTVFNLYLVMRSLKDPPEIKSEKWEMDELEKESLPVYTIFCPLYKEAHMLPGFLDAIGKLDWPKDKLDILLLLEESDKATIETAEHMGLPPQVRIIVVPESLPKTKPKACNYGLAFARGEYTVIYDAEDIPDPLQLKKAYLGFKKVPRSVGCLQAKLNYFNPNQNLLTKLFTVEYSLWFDMILPGLQSINTSIPLGGTSNHFRTKDLLELEGWDPFNVTEDCDLGMRIFKNGFTTTIIDSVTLEEANSDLKNWLRQRSRWIKGYIQTYLVHMRHPMDFFRENGVHALIFQLVVGGKTVFIFINPILWMATFSYFALYGLVGPMIEKLYPSVIFFMAATSLVFGNFLAMYYYMIGCAKRGQWLLIKYVFLVPFYWALMSVASVIAVYQLIMKPHFWEKTNHGLHLLKKTAEAPREILPVARKTAPAFNWEKVPHPEYAGMDHGSLLPEKPAAADLSAGRKRKRGFSWRKVPLGGYWKMLFEPKNIFIAAIMFSNVINFIFNIFLGRALSFENLALVTLVSSLWYLVSIFTSALSSTVNSETGYLSSSGKKESSVMFLEFVKSRGVLLSLIAAFAWVIAGQFLSEFFNIKDHYVLLLFAPVFIFGIISASNSGFLQGNLYFSSAAVVMAVEPISKLLFAMILVYSGASGWVYAAIPFSIMAAAIVSSYFIKRKNNFVPEKIKLNFPKKFYLSSLAAGISMMLFFSMDIILVKHYLPERMAGEYVMLSFVGKMIYFMGTLPIVFLIPLVSRNMGQKKDSKKIFSLVYISSFLLSILGVFFLGVMGRVTVPGIFGPKVSGILPYLNIYAISVLLLVITNVIVTYHLARKRYIYSFMSIMIPLGMVLGLSLYHNSIRDVVAVIFWSSCFGWVLMEAMSVLEGRAKFIRNNLNDLADVFKSGYPSVGPTGGDQKKILIYNWRDTRHEYAGGAEVYIQKIAENWVEDGHRVTIFCGNDSHSPRSEKVGGVEIIRRGGFYFVYFWAFVYYILRFRGKFDVIIDCENGIPFFAPLYAREPVFCLMHHVHQEVFRLSLSKHLSALACFLEKVLMPAVYKKVPFITISESSKKEIESLGLGKAGINIVNPGIELKCLMPGKKSERPVILYLGRLKAYKSVDILIRAFEVISRKDSNVSLVIAGSGEEEGKLKRLVKKLRLDGKTVRFAGKVSEREKISLLQKAWVLVNPSFMEGWGIVAIEAGACGTPVVASDVPGLRDSVKNFETGYLACYGDIGSFADCIHKIIQDNKLRRRMGIRGRLWAENFDWAKSSKLFFAIISSLQIRRIKDELAFYKNRVL
jgi:cellulose synthase/poly-beta-1,6-N-acetylglucosamine synthase-like glycosyltransferase/glycosyltransferase involved in cell wall biosynthesis/O-antigen/teichoic acid export membrane protein